MVGFSLAQAFTPGAGCVCQPFSAPSRGFCVRIESPWKGLMVFQVVAPAPGVNAWAREKKRGTMFISKPPLIPLLSAALAFLVAPRPCWAAESETSHQWLSLPIAISGLPADADSVPVSCLIDFSGLLVRLKAAGAVDERSLRLDHILPDGRVQEEPVQFSPDPQPGSKARRLLPGTVPQVSYLAEYPAGETPEVKVAGRLSWIAQADRDGKQHYRLRFGVPRTGRIIQVPFPPQNLRAFDGQGGARRLAGSPTCRSAPSGPWMARFT